MKQKKKSAKMAGNAILMLLIVFMTGCASTRREEEQMSALDEAQERMEKIETEEQDFDSIPERTRNKRKAGNRDSNGVPILATTLPMIRFSGRGVKVEFEHMLLTNLSLLEDMEASAGYATVLSDNNSRAEFSITLPAGRYECLLSEKATDAAHATVSVSIGADNYNVYPSNPPLGIWELTTRVPIYFDVPEEQPYLVTISSAFAGMSLDYIQFVKLQ